MDAASVECQQKLEMTKIKNETTENNSDRESSIESFHTNKSELSITTETELIDVDDIELSDEESWLYKSPKKLTSEEKSESTEKWLEKNIDDMNDMELKATRTALLSKLNQLKLLNSSILENEVRNVGTIDESCSVEAKLVNQKRSKSCDYGAGKNQKALIDSSCVSSESSHQEPRKNSGVFHVDVLKFDKLQGDKFESQGKVNNYNFEADSSHIDYKTEMKSECDDYVNSSLSDCQESRKTNELFDVVDVQKIARLQEESLKQSTYKFLSQGGKKIMRIKDLSPSLSSQCNLNKPASVEALNTCADKMSSSNVYSLVPLHGMKKQNMFSSSTALNNSHEFHRGSLPNINKGYYSLKTKKSKRPSEPKLSCPLPTHPSHSKISVNGTLSQNKKSELCEQRETRTLPSSYRVHSRSNSSSRREFNTLPISPRRESMPFLGSNSQELGQKDNHRKYSSPSIHPRYSTSATVSPAKVYSSHTQNLRSPPGIEPHRTASHSPTKRLPLSTVQHHSPKKGNNLPFCKNGEIRTLKLPSKIPSPGLRSGIPVPSSAYSKANEDDTWSQDCF